jgi:hypothetical protein
MPKLKSLKAIPATVHVVEPPPMEFEPPHKLLARLTAEQERLVKEIREHKTAWARRNMVAQHKRQTVASAELTAFREHHADLSKALAEVNLRIGEVNREMRAVRAARMQPRVDEPDPPIRRNGFKQEGPMKRHKEFPVYFMLAAEQQLDAKLFDRIVSVAKSLLGNALAMGVEEE